MSFVFKNNIFEINVNHTVYLSNNCSRMLLQSLHSMHASFIATFLLIDFCEYLRGRGIGESSALARFSIEKWLFPLQFCFWSYFSPRTRQHSNLAPSSPELRMRSDRSEDCSVWCLVHNLLIPLKLKKTFKNSPWDTCDSNSLYTEQLTINYLNHQANNKIMKIERYFVAKCYKYKYSIVSRRWRWWRKIVLSITLWRRRRRRWRIFWTRTSL